MTWAACATKAREGSFGRSMAQRQANASKCYRSLPSKAMPLVCHGINDQFLLMAAIGDSSSNAKKVVTLPEEEDENNGDDGDDDDKFKEKLRDIARREAFLGEGVKRVLDELNSRREELKKDKEANLKDVQRQLDEVRRERECISEREQKFADESARRQTRFDEERKVLDNCKKLLDDDRRKFHQEVDHGKRLLDEDRRRFHQERYTYGEKKDDSRLTKFLKRLEIAIGMPGKLIGLKTTAEEFRALHLYVIPSLIAAFTGGSFWQAARKVIDDGARTRVGAGMTPPNFCPRCGFELPMLAMGDCPPCAAVGAPSTPC